MTSQLSELYKKLSGLPMYDIDVIISGTKEEDLPKVYKKLIWNIQRGTRINLNNWIGRSFAEIICQLATKTNISSNENDRDNDGRYGYDDWRINKDLEFAHEYIEDCEHVNEDKYAFLIRESEEGYILVDEDGINKLMTDEIN